MKPSEDKVEAVKEILNEVLIKYPLSDYPYRENINERYAKEICRLFPVKIKLPENPMTQPDNAWAYEKALQQVRELNEVE